MGHKTFGDILDCGGAVTFDHKPIRISIVYLTISMCVYIYKDGWIDR